MPRASWGQSRGTRLEDVQEGVCDPLAMSASRKWGEQVPLLCDLHSRAPDSPCSTEMQSSAVF